MYIAVKVSKKLILTDWNNCLA